MMLYEYMFGWTSKTRPYSYQYRGVLKFYYGKVILIFIFNYDDPVMLTIKPITLP